MTKQEKIAELKSKLEDLIADEGKTESAFLNRLKYSYGWLLGAELHCMESKDKDIEQKFEDFLKKI